MTASTYDEALRRVLAHEGGYTNHPSDPGGPTNWGITIQDARKYWKARATAADVQAMPVAVGDGVDEAPRFAVLGAWPNPARDAALLRYSMPAPGRAWLEVYDLGGRRVASRDLGVQSPGARQAWLTRDELGPGLYFYRIGIENPAGGAARALGGKVVFLK